jgi:hypothetical protein
VNDDGKLNANLNEFQNDNVWNGDNEYRIFSSKLLCFSSLNWRSFLFQTFLPAAEHFSNLV